MQHETRLYVGTRRGLFRFCTADDRRSWRAGDPALLGWNVFHAVEDPRDPSRVYAAANHDVWGPRVARSQDGGRTWEDRNTSPSFEVADGLSVEKTWVVRPGHADRPGEVWAGVDPGALFRSHDWGASWTPVTSLNQHPTRALWNPGGGGLCLHNILLHPTDPERLLVTVSAGGTYASEDGGTTWQPRNQGVAADFMPDPDVEAGHCVHKVVRSAGDPEQLFQQNHCGHFRSSDEGRSWQEVQGLPSTFGFVAAAHPHDADTLYVSPLKGDDFRAYADGAMTVWRSRDGGDSWQPLRCGLPQQGAYLSAMRSAMCTDGRDRAGIYIGTSTGQIFASRDDGDSWSLLADYLPPILSLEIGETA